MLIFIVWALLSWAAIRWIEAKEAEYDKQRKLKWGRSKLKEQDNAK